MISVHLGLGKDRSSFDTTAPLSVSKFPRLSTCERYFGWTNDAIPHWLLLNQSRSILGTVLYSTVLNSEIIDANEFHKIVQE